MDGVDSAVPGDGGVTVGADGLRLGAERLPLVAGGVCYARLPRERWASCLDAAAALGLPLVEVAVAWSVHEVAPGTFRFEGAGRGEDPPRRPERAERELGLFLEECTKRRLRVLARLGPAVGGELNDFGLPERLQRDERCLARGPGGNRVILPTPPRVFALPSLASRRYLEEAEAWLRAAAAFLASYSWPDGPVVAARLDLELHQLRGGIYDQDYHADAVALYRELIAARYPDGLPAVHGASLAELEPPRRFSLDGGSGALLRHLDWASCREQMQERALGRFAASVRDAGLTRVALLTAAPAVGGLPPWSVVELEGRTPQITAGIHLLARGRDEGAVRRAAALLGGSSRLPLLELEQGGRPWWFPLGAADQQAQLMHALMHGARALSLPMLVDRDRWYGAALRADGARSGERPETLRRLLAALTEASLFSLERDLPVGLLRRRDAEHLARCTCSLEPLPPLALELVGLAGAELSALQPDDDLGLREHEASLAAAEQALQRLRLPYRILDGEAPVEELRRCRLLVAPTLRLASRALLEHLARAVADGGPPLLWAPRPPELDERLAPLPASSLPAPARSASAAELEPTLRELDAQLGLAPAVTVDDPQVELTLYRERAADNDARQLPLRLLFAASSAASERKVAVRGLPPALEARDALSGAPLDLGALRLAPRQVRMILLGRASSPEAAP